MLLFYDQIVEFDAEKVTPGRIGADIEGREYEVK
jgi:hypothetical protein